MPLQIKNEHFFVAFDNIDAFNKLWHDTNPHELEPHASSNQKFNWFLLNFLHTCTVILPLVTWTLNNWNLPLSRSKFFSPSDHFCIIVHLIMNHVLSMWQVGKNIRKKNPVHWRSPKHWIRVYFKISVSILCLYFFVTPTQIVSILVY